MFKCSRVIKNPVSDQEQKKRKAARKCAAFLCSSLTPPSCLVFIEKSYLNSTINNDKAAFRGSFFEGEGERDGGNMKLLFTVAALLMFLSDSYASDFRGIKIGSNIKDAEEIARSIAKSELIMADNNFLFATHVRDIPVRVFVKADNGIVGSIEFRFSRDNYTIIRDAMFDKYGSGFKIATQSFVNGFGAKFIYEKATKITRTEIITIEEKSRFDDLESYANIISQKFLDNKIKNHQSRPGF